MGELSEDICLDGGQPDRQLHDEDTAHLGGVGGVVNSAEDVGLDGVSDQNEHYKYPNLITNTWDSVGYGDSALPYKTALAAIISGRIPMARMRLYKPIILL